jgi:hypothetical protein
MPPGQRLGVATRLFLEFRRGCIRQPERARLQPLGAHRRTPLSCTLGTGHWSVHIHSAALLVTRNACKVEGKLRRLFRFLRQPPQLSAFAQSPLIVDYLKMTASKNHPLEQTPERSIRVAVPAGAAIADAHLAIDREAYERIIRGRDERADKLRFGIIALNAGSLLALLSALGGEGQAAKWLGFTASNATLAAGAFVGGLILGSASVFFQQNSSTREAGDAFKRYAHAGLVVALSEAVNSEDNRARLSELREGYANLPLVGFRQSILSVVCQNAAQGLWLLGIAIPLMRALGMSG